MRRKGMGAGAGGGGGGGVEGAGGVGEWGGGIAQSTRKPRAWNFNISPPSHWPQRSRDMQMRIMSYMW